MGLVLSSQTLPETSQSANAAELPVCFGQNQLRALHSSQHWELVGNGVREGMC